MNEINMNENMMKILRLVGYILNKKFIKQAEEDLGINKSIKIEDFEALFKSCCHSYTHKKFKKIQKNVYFSTIFKFFYYSKNNSSDSKAEESDKNTGSFSNQNIESGEISKDSENPNSEESLSKFSVRIDEIFND